MPRSRPRRGLATWVLAAPFLALLITACSGAPPADPPHDGGPEASASLDFSGDYELAYSGAALVGATGLDGVTLVDDNGYLGFSWTPTSTGSTGLSSQLATQLTIVCLDADCVTTPGAGKLVLDGDAPQWDPYIVSTAGGLLDGCGADLLLEPAPVRDIVEQDGQVVSFAATVGLLFNETWSSGSAGCAEAASATVEMTASRVG